MLVIRAVQLDALARANWRDFHQTAYRHCCECYPEVCARLGEEGVWDYVRAGLSRARAQGLESARDLLRYLNLVFMFGPEFERLPWAEPILADRSYAPGTRIAILTECALRELQPTSARAEKPAAEPVAEAAPPGGAFEGWPETPPAPVPEPPVLQPPGESCLPPAPPDLFRRDEHYAW